jgi:beta-glucanase (GH16 family)
MIVSIESYCVNGNSFILITPCTLDTNKALHFYSSENAKTKNGVLKILTEQKENSYKAFDETKKTFYADKKYIQSAMLQSWNKFCFVGGIIEFRAKLPGDPKIGGLWPARKCSIVFLALCMISKG